MMKFSDYITRSVSFGHQSDCCGTCGSHLYDHNGLYTCQCRASPYHGDFTEYDDICDEYHARGTTREKTAPQFDD